MMDFIMVPLVVGIITLGIYKLFELFARKKERLAMIEKIGDKFDASMVEGKFTFPAKTCQKSNYGTMKIACLLLGVGLGLMVGFFIVLNTIGLHYPDESRFDYREFESVIYGSSVLLFGGLGLLIAFLIEMKSCKKSEK
ncbi:MAG: hypothetical protein PHR38_06840 [Bacteroidales bacterium]|nr:hypothetical protein [Bacteroidales bacterium]MDD4712602.1 hypothetical protein [Bacteroidales bacterium]MEA4841371.1 DUF6249 domain-containing protein [Bacteroidales bacterium]